MIKVNTPIVSIHWLHQNFEAKNLIILDATITKVGSKSNFKKDKKVIKNARFFDIKKTFSDVNSKYPNTVLPSDVFEIEVQKLGINQDSCIIVYDDLGVYSSPRVWWMFKLMGFNNIAVLDGGLPAWEKANFLTENFKEHFFESGNFKTNFQSEKIKETAQVLSEINNEEVLIVDARSKGRFFATEPEPRKEVSGGHIPNSVNLPYGKLLQNKFFKSSKELKRVLKEINPNRKEFIFSCGSGITASILALGAEISNYKKYSVYDGSWTEWGSTKNLPIEKNDGTKLV